MGERDKSIVYLDLATGYLNQLVYYINDFTEHMQNRMDMPVPTPAPISTSESAPASTQMTTPNSVSRQLHQLVFKQCL